ncbi:MAG: LPXTG cell wall anchor domain-containing protein, partial [Peptostreptococcaceae bacterium]|nr:LPXTG cell wall anchor domain-containing protein [Peptostreptococcaceae bacterium]
PTPNNQTPNNPTPNNPTPVKVKIYQPRPNNPTTDNPIPDTNITNNPKDKTNIENIKKAVETKKVYTIVDKQNRPIGVARVVIKDNKLVLEYIDDPDVPRSGTIKYDGDDNSIEMIEEDTPLSNIDEDKILPKTGQSSDESRKIAVFVLMLLAIYLRRKNKNI